MELATILQIVMFVVAMGAMYLSFLSDSM